MDFKKLLNKLDSMDAPKAMPAAPQIAPAVQLNEDAQLRVLSGRTTYVAEAKKKAEEDVKEEMKVGDKKASSTGGTIEKTKTGIKHTAGKNYGGDKAPKDDDEDAPKAKKKTAKESIDTEAFKGKFAKMVEAKKKGGKPDFLDMDKDGDKKEPMKKAVADKGGDKKEGGKKGMSAAQAKYFGKKKTVKESVENILSFKEMIQLVQESGGQQQIDAVDQELFAWAQRVAKQKIGEGLKADVYAGMVYERMGGVFEMYDVLSEDQK